MLYSEAQQVLTNKQIILWGSYSQELVRTDATARESPECQILKTTTNDGRKILGGRPQKRKMPAASAVIPLREGHGTGWQAVAITRASPGGAARAAHALPPAYSGLQRERARALPMNVVARGRSCILEKKTVLSYLPPSRGLCREKRGHGTAPGPHGGGRGAGGSRRTPPGVPSPPLRISPPPFFFFFP